MNIINQIKNLHVDNALEASIIFGIS